MHLYADPAWSPDGTRVLFTSNRGGTPWLYTVRTDGTALTRLPLPSRITGAHQGDWSRDGRIIFSPWTQVPVNPAKMSAEAPTPTPTEPAMAVMSAPEAVTGYNRIISYEYDSLYRLTGATYTEGTSVNEYAYGYDLRGNRTSVTAPEVGTFTYSYNLANQIDYPDFTYDPNGNLTGDGYATYTYDAANRLRGVVTGVGTATTYQYDGLGNRISMTHNGVESAYLLDPSGALSQVLRESTGGVETLYLHGLDIIGQKQGSAWTTLGYDPLGSVRFLLNSSGDLTHALNYDPYGVPLQPNTESTTLGFTGEQTDPNDLLYLRARYYHPKLGAFTSVDPVLGVGGSTGWNGYLYANANPANLTDPSGRCIGLLTFLLPVCIGAAKVVMTAVAGAVVAGAADLTINQHVGVLPFGWDAHIYDGRSWWDWEKRNSYIDWEQNRQAISTGAYLGGTIGLWLAAGVFSGASIAFSDMTTKVSSSVFWGTVVNVGAYGSSKIIPNLVSGKVGWNILEGITAFDIASHSFWGSITNLLSMPLGGFMKVSNFGLQRSLIGYSMLGMSTSTMQYLTNYALTGVRPTKTDAGFVASILSGSGNWTSRFTGAAAFFFSSLSVNTIANMLSTLGDTPPPSFLRSPLEAPPTPTPVSEFPPFGGVWPWQRGVLTPTTPRLLLDMIGKLK